MNTEDYIRGLQEDFSLYYTNLKAEVLISELLENTNLAEEDLSIIFDGSFTRGFRRDIIDSKVNNNQKLEVRISRNGIYDAMPEGVFHKPVGIDTGLSHSDVRQKNRKEEKDARLFFAPIENEFFLHRVYVEQEEKKILSKLNNSIENSFIIDFWDIRHKVPKEYIFLFVKALPYAYKISKNEKLIAQSLEDILNEKVEIIKKFEPLVNNTTSKESTLLGINTSLAVDKTSILYPYYYINIKISNLKNRYLFLKGGIGSQLISVFCQYFVPLEIEYEVSVDYIQNNEVFSLNEESTILGLSTTL